MLKDLTDQINFQRPVKRLRTEVSQFLFNTNYSNNNLGKEETNRMNSTILHNLDEYDEDDSQWLRLLSHSTTYSENYFYSTIRIKNTSKYYPTLIFVLDNFEILTFKLPNHFSELEWTCQCHINYQIARHMNELSILSIQKNQPKKYFQFNIFDGPLIQLSSLLSENSTSIASTSNIPFSFFLYDSFPILEVLFPCRYIQATTIHENVIELHFYSNYTEKKYFWIRKRESEWESDLEPNDEPALALASKSIIKLYSEHYMQPSSSFIYPMSDISFVIRDDQETTILGTKKKTCLWLDSNSSIRQSLVMPHIPIEL
ncbi:hypothetical protein PIROE2DRAFT_13688 [Piromyces sp. E2]|nr:hypothetical protein PIROE2DRAFT_13688 [Piromyces sp. E2]|eukprot:OUM60533.1 hypothetical protein PIROE2DRAFT_13688 [Piromyces sp. E2]